MSNSDNNGTQNSGSAKSGGANRRKRNYRHFGPSGSSGESSTAGGTARNGPVEQNRDESGSRRDRSSRSADETANTAANQRKTDSASRSGSKSKSRRSRGGQGRTSAQSPPEQNTAAQAERIIQPQQEAKSPGKKSGQTSRPDRQEQTSRVNRQKTAQSRSARWEKKIKAEETYEDIKQDIDRIEKEIWLEIAGLHTIKLDY